MQVVLFNLMIFSLTWKLLFCSDILFHEICPAPFEKQLDKTLSIWYVVL